MRLDLQRNSIIADVDKSTSALLLEHGRVVNLAVRDVVYEAEVPIETVDFPLDCVLSVVARMSDGSAIEIGTIGREGTSALPLLMGADATANVCYAQVPGESLRISANDFREIVRHDAPLRSRLDRYLQAYVNMLGQLAACNRLHHVTERCARWLLMTHDRVDGDRLPLTHEFLAMMLGARRSGVTIAALSLQTAGLITYARGIITIRDRHGLEEVACECYAVARSQFQGLLRSVSSSKVESQP